MYNQQRTMIGGLPTSYVQMGDGKKDLLLLHGWESSKEAFSGIIPELSDAGYRVTAVDMPGFGNTPLWTEKKKITLQDYVDWTEECREVLKLQHVQLIGHSFGGSVGIVLGAQEKPWVESLVLIATAGVRESTNWRSRTLGLIARMVRPLRYFGPLDAFIMRVGEKFHDEDLKNATGAKRELIRELFATDLQHLLHQVTPSTLILWGDKDQSVPKQHIEKIAQGIPQAEMITLKGAGHYPFIDEPDECVSALIGFFAGK